MLFEPVDDYLKELPMKDIPFILETTFPGEDPNFAYKLVENIQLADQVKELLKSLSSEKITVQVFH